MIEKCTGWSRASAQAMYAFGSLDDEHAIRHRARAIHALHRVGGYAQIVDGDRAGVCLRSVCCNQCANGTRKTPSASSVDQVASSINPFSHPSEGRWSVVAGHHKIRAAARTAQQQLRESDAHETASRVAVVSRWVCKLAIRLRLDRLLLAHCKGAYHALREYCIPRDSPPALGVC